MIRPFAAAALAALHLMPALPAAADEIPSATAHTVRLAEGFTAVVHYVETPAGFQVATSMAAEDGPLIRFTNHLASGQSVVLEAAGAVGEPSSGVVLSRIGDTLHAVPLPGAARAVAAGPGPAS